MPKRTVSGPAGPRVHLCVQEAWLPVSPGRWAVSESRPPWMDQTECIPYRKEGSLALNLCF